MSHRFAKCWDRTISNDQLVYSDGDRQVARPGAQSISPAALVQAEVGWVTFCITRLPHSRNKLSVGMAEVGFPTSYTLGFGQISNSWGLRREMRMDSSVSGAGTLLAAGVLLGPSAALHEGDTVRMRYDAARKHFSINVNGKDVHVFTEVPDGKYVIGATLPDDAKLAIIRWAPPPLMQTLGRTLWEESLCADLTVCAGERTFQCHRCILAAASPVFQAMIEAPMLERQEQTINIDASTDALEVVLRHIYVGAGIHGVSLACEVLRLAHMYELDSLMVSCCDTLLAELHPDSVHEIVETLRPLRESPDICTKWEELSCRIESEPSLVRAMLNGPPLKKSRKDPE